MSYVSLRDTGARRRKGVRNRFGHFSHFNNGSRQLFWAETCTYDNNANRSSGSYTTTGANRLVFDGTHVHESLRPEMPDRDPAYILHSRQGKP